MKLATVEALRVRLGLPEDPGVDAAIGGALESATVYLATALKTKMEKHTKTDVFFLNGDLVEARNGYYRLLLSSGFLRSNTPVSIMYGTDDTAQTSSAIGCTIRYEEGWVSVPETYLGKYLAVTYQAGFLEDEEAPSWLVETAIGFATKMLSVQQIGDQRPEMAEVYKFVDTTAGFLLDSHLRAKGAYLRPRD